MSEHDDLIATLMPVSTAFNQLGVRFCISGSVASSFHGAARSTMDVDLVAEMTEDIVPAFVSYFGNDFYVSESAVREAIGRKGCFNLIHLPTSFKVDIFVSRQRPFDLSVMHRATLANLGNVPSLEVPIATAEDAILSKLEWYRKTNETSSRQWEDVTRLLKLLGDHADINYLKKQAEELEIDDLLTRLIEG
ncbi:MAG: hypothetical protein HUJ26_18000 [Planctomycetaceae bacterium]|nr:hypothetical protein [Planctomycetaceae bacterium]